MSRRRLTVAASSCVTRRGCTTQQEASEERRHARARRPRTATTVPGIVKSVHPSRFIQHDTAAEMRWDRVDPGYLTPVDRFFVRNQSVTPRVGVGDWRLRIEGPGVTRPLSLSYDEILSLPSVTVVRALECAGNGRAFFAVEHGHALEGHGWMLGGVGVAEWTGVPLTELLQRAGALESAVDVMPIGADELQVRRPMPIAKALEEDTLLAVAMNGEPLQPDHGFPARVLVPGWAGISSIKWVEEICVSLAPLSSPWSTESYVLRGPAYETPEHPHGKVIHALSVKSALELPWPADLVAGRRDLHGRAWSALGRVALVDVSLDGGRTWAGAELVAPNEPRAWVRWLFRWDAVPGAFGIRVRATDEFGNTQPDHVSWNNLGYEYDGVVAHPVVVHP